ncbi:ABC-F family ATP-binding cassette domain-containing protein [Leifsonia sp. PS1209]|uniref:ABC-F family ATP-binding cassette domain-containing protein n=1 Tax=Leifsonia sp. PS1209 TaxID=2724914 RepID=UPI001442D337|nr:ABC-F family ATP-binding cassette domain-containing protein [Leifsonia sp. PS1209]QIZ97846.1 ABC-F family ATP-binding cassette domain-containing protein [Leifsonia sp. PS1209]
MPVHFPTIIPVAAVADHLKADGISQSYGDRRVLTDVSLTVAPGSRLGLIGENGVGKSTLLRILGGAEAPDGGALVRPARTGILWQEVRFTPEDTLTALMESALVEVRAIERELEASASALAGDDPDADAAAGAAAASRYAAALDAAERADIWSVGARRDELLDGLGVGSIPLHRRLSEVSGGQRSRFALAALLLSRPDALLLDEPTNHLDDDAALFLERQLIAWRGPVVFASHDRAFLDAVATSLLDLDPSRSGTTVFGGNYSAYLAAKADERERWERQFADEQDELKALKFAVDVTARGIAWSGKVRDNDKFAKSFKGGALDKQISRRIKNASGRLDDLSENQVRKPPAILSFAGIPTGSQALNEEAGTLVQVSDARIPDRLDVVSFRVEPQSRILITGHNGAGKSTLLSALAGRQPVDSGAVTRRKGLRVGLLEQDVRFADPAASPRRIYEERLGERRAEAVPLTGLGLVAPRDVDRPVGTLSIGQQRRLALALILAKPPHVFLLDEPTNHLSLSLATELEEALGAYPGAVVVASHDRWLRGAWTGERVEMAGGRIVA